MSFNWLDYLALAKFIKDNPDTYSHISEAAYRASVSRAYYAVFRSALNMARKEGFKPSWTGDDHIRIRTFLRESAAAPTAIKQNRRKASVELDRLCDFRRSADYDDKIRGEVKHLATNAINMADRIAINLSI